MAIEVIRHIKDAIGNLNPEDIRRHTERPLRLLLYANSPHEYRQMEGFFAPGEVRHPIYRATEETPAAASHDLEIYFDDSGAAQPAASDTFAFRPESPGATVHEILRRRPELAIPLALHVTPFREEVSRRIVRKVARENALFALATALPDIVPLLSLPWAVGEFASDTAFLTANQIRMAFLLAAANGREVGYAEQKGEIGSIVLGAFGWRGLARELVGKIPWGGGLVPKAAIAYAGTRVMGFSIERYYRLGYGYTRAERRVAYQDALERGRQWTASLVDNLKKRS
jgi:hypothetical protein